jgi:hypothetical protein
LPSEAETPAAVGTRERRPRRAAHQQACTACSRMIAQHWVIAGGSKAMINIELELVSDVNLDQALSILARTLAA